MKKKNPPVIIKEDKDIEKGKIIMFKKKFGRFELEKRICENGLMNDIIKEKYNLCPFRNLLD